MAFIVVQFLETDDVSIIAQSWLVDESTCKWPPYKSKLLIKRALLEKKPPENDWEDYEIFIMGIHETYAKAKKEVAAAINTDSDDDNQRPESSKRQKVDSVLNSSQVAVKREVSDSVSTSTPNQPLISNGSQESAQVSSQNHRNNQNSSASVITRNIGPTQVSSQNLTNGEFLSLLESEVLVLNDNSATQSIVLPDNVSMQLALIPSNTSTNGRNESTPGSSQPVNNHHSSASKSCSCDCSHSTELLKKVLGAVEDLKIDIAEIQQNSKLIKQALLSSYEDLDDEWDLPIKTIDHLTEVNIRIGSVKDFSKMVKYLGLFGSQDVNQAVRRIMSKLITNKLALQFNWQGSSTRKGFKEYTSFVELVTAAVRQNYMCRNVLQKDCEDIIKRWLRTAVDRDGGRNNRIKKKKSKAG